MHTHIFALVGCGPQCWEAKDDVCRCSCGGRNHGIRRNNAPGCEHLKRQLVYDGYIFELANVSEPHDMGYGHFSPSRFDDEAMAANTAAGIQFYYAHTARKHYGYFPVAIVRVATDSQIAKWPELANWRGKVSPLYGKPYLFWKRRDDLTQEVARHTTQLDPQVA